MPSALTVAPRAAVPLTPVLALLGGACAMGISPVFVRLADVGPFASAFWRVGLALPMLWAWTLREERGRPPGAPPARRFAKPTILAGLVFFGDILCWHLAIIKTSIANGTFFATMAPVWVVLVSWLFLGQRVSRGVVVGLAACLVGGLALVAQSLQANASHVVGDLLGVVTGFFFGLYFLAVSAARRDAGAARVTFEMSLIAATALLVAALIREGDLLPHSPRGWAALFALAWISHAGGQGLLTVALGRLPAVFSSLVIFLEAIAAALFAWVILGEAVTAIQALGAVAILLGIWIARPRRSSDLPVASSS